MQRILYNLPLKGQKTLKTHIICWTIFITYEVLISSIVNQFFKPFIFYLAFYSLNISLFYFHSLILLGKGVRNNLNDIWRISVFVIIELIIYYGLSSIIIFLLIELGYEKLQNPYFTGPVLTSTLWRGTYFMLYATGYYYLFSFNLKKENHLLQKIENEKLKNDLLRAEQDFLRAQINPHLLFNTLSFIKYAAKKNPLQADEAVMRLSSIMGFALDTNTPTIRLVKELIQVENIIALNQLRFNNSLHIDYETRIHHPNIMIIPIIVLTLVENIFKHGNLLDENYPAKIKIRTKEDQIEIMTSNLPNKQSKVKSHHTGLNNIASRLRQSYPGHHHFEYGMHDRSFEVTMKISTGTT